MSLTARRVLLGVMLACLVTGLGCSPGTLLYFLLPEPKEEPRMRRLASDKEEKPRRVAILTYSGLETRAEFIQADRQLADLLTVHLKKLTDDNKEKLVIVPANVIDRYKSRNPDWHQRDLREIGKAVDADFLIYLEINSLSMYEPGSANQLYSGRIDLGLNLIDMRDPDENKHEPFRCVYPSQASGPRVTEFDANPNQFRRDFLNHVARELSWHFARYPRRHSLFTE